MITRKEYMVKPPSYTHREFFAQFVTPSMFRLFGKAPFTREALLAGKDDHLNNIGLRSWDRLAFAIDTPSMRRKIRATGENCAPSTWVCIIKEAARQYVEQD